MRILKSIFLCGVVFGFIASAYAQSYPHDIQQIKQRGYLIVAVPTLRYPPFFYLDKNNKLAGFDIRLAKDVAHRLGVKVKFYHVPKTFDDVAVAISAKKADLVFCNFSETLTRAQFIRYSEPYLTMHLTILVSRSWAAQHKLTASSGQLVRYFKSKPLLIGAMEGSSYVKDAEHLFPHATIKTFSSLSAEFKAVLSGKINAVFHDEVQIKKFMLESPSATLKLKAIVLRSNPDLIGTATAYNNVALMHWFNLYLKLNKLHYDADAVLKDVRSH
ncbi:MAG: amino acid ABC transporter substrate-binding protein [Gammaproteobacteria bacterium]|nr:amino acid ABC transporter substrate-binding protein [Gammaproteobacteria bacterium]